MRTKAFYFSLAVVAIFYASVMLLMNNQLVKQQKVSNANYAALTEQIKHYRLKDSSNIAHSKALQLQISAIRQTMPGIISQLEQLNIKPSRTETIIQTVTESAKQISAPLRDTLLIINKDSTPARRFTYTDKFYFVDGTILPTRANLSIFSRDTVFTAIYKGKRPKPWLWILSPRQLEVKQRNANPANIVTYSRVIQVK